MKNVYFLILFGFVGTANAQKKPMIPDLIASSEKIPVYLSGLNLKESGIFVVQHYPDALSPTESYEDIDSKPYPDFENLVSTLVNTLNDQFDTDKFYVERSSESWKTQNPELFVGLFLRLDYQFVNKSEPSDDEYSIYKQVFWSFRKFENNKEKQIKGLSLLYDPAESFKSEKEYRSVEDFQSEYPSANYLEGVSSTAEAALISECQKILKKYKKKK